MTGITLCYLLALFTTARVQASSHAKRAITTDATSIDSQSYDYIIVGCGTAGLSVASRLAENSTSTSVLCIEAGDDGSAVQDQILAPAMAYYNGLAGTTSDYDWHFNTVNQTNLNSRPIFWPRGKLLGGSSAVNGAYMTRASKLEMDAWGALQTDGLEDWSWKGTYPYMKKAETFAAPIRAHARAANMSYVQSAHGTDGPIHMSYSGYLFDQQTLWIPTLANLNVTQPSDSYSGNTTGSRFSLSAINQSNYTRSYSKTGYLNVDRPNLTVLTGQTVTKILFGDSTSDGVPATGVSFAANASASSYTANANKEVILTSGVVGSAHLLQVSGVGEASLLSSIGVDQVVDLPGVGHHLNDHLSGALTFDTTAEVTGDLIKSNTTYAAEQLALWKTGSAESLYTAPNNAIAYLSLEMLMGSSDAQALVSQMASNKTSATSNLNASDTVKAGFQALYDAEVQTLLPSEAGAVEILMGNTGSGDGSVNTIVIQAAIQRPLSRGALKAVSASIFDAPDIDPGYLTEDGDMVILREAFKYARRVSQTAPLSDILTRETSPGTSVSTDAEWEAYLRGSVSTEYHPAGSCAMLPLDLGGCVNTQLKVYGTSNVRVIDSSVIPVGLAAHLTEPTYGIAEKGAAIILNGTAAQPSSSSGASSSASPSGANAAKESSSALLMRGSLPLALLLSGLCLLF